MPSSCPACGVALPPGARFCPECGHRLGPDAAGAPAEPIEERRTVTIVFADLAGFTERSDQADPEDVRRILLPFHALAKEEIERFGGTLDKFIGDAAMGVFGAPVAHEDDPERAMRAALAIRDRVREMDMPVRVAVNTGEAVVTFASGPQVGENVAGDVVNTASRLQSVAPVGDVVAGEATERITAGVVRYEPMGDVTVKGKAEPVSVWIARSMGPSSEPDDDQPLVGRTRERQLLRELMDRTVTERSVHLVTVVGEPGIGKTRLVNDLIDHVQDRSDAAWHRGRCLPYGEGITFAALEEIVRAAAGIGAADDREAAAARLADEVERLEPRAAERDWLVVCLSPLIGLSAPTDDVTIDRQEQFAAWTRFLEAEADPHPLVLIVEDLHWADAALLGFLDHLVDAAQDSPILLLCTARGELFTQHPTWGGGKPNTTTVSLSPLSDAEMQELVTTSAAGASLPDGSEDALLARAGGNPLFALEFVQMLKDRPSTDAEGGTTEIMVPDTVQSLIAARLDSLRSGERALLQDASVVGERFWQGALSALEPHTEIGPLLSELQRRGLVRRVPISSIENETEFRFSHALIRDVAYGQLPRAGRSRRHATVAQWLDTGSDAQMPELPDLLAHHGVEALDLAKAAGLDRSVPELEERALRYLTLAAERQRSLDAPRAAEYFRQALALAPDDDPVQRANLIRRATIMGWRSGLLTADDALAAYREGLALALDAGDHQAAAKIMRRLYFQLALAGDTAEARRVLDRGIELLEGDAVPTPLLAELYACRSEDAMFAGRSDGSLRWAERALELPAASETTIIMALHLRGNARCELGHMSEGLEDLEEALRISEAASRALDTVTSYSYLAEWAGMRDGPRPTVEMYTASIEIAERRGLLGQRMWARVERLWPAFDLGQWDLLLEETQDLIAWAEDKGDAQVQTASRFYRARVLSHRGQLDEARSLVEAFLPQARAIEDLQILAPALAVASQVALAAQDPAGALALLEEFDIATLEGPQEYREIQVPEAVRTAIAAGDVELARRLPRDIPYHSERVQLAAMSAGAFLLEADGRIEDAAERFDDVAARWDRWGGIPERTFALTGLARCQASLGRGTEAAATRALAEALRASLAITGE